MRPLALLPLAFALTGCISGTLTDLGTPEGFNSGATDLNREAVVVGYTEDTASVIRPFIWRAGTMTRIVIPGGSNSVQSAQAINDAEQVVGRMGAPTVASHAFLWQGGTLTSLGSGDDSSEAGDINETGDVVGTWTREGRGTQATVWSRGARTELPPIAGDRSVGHAIGKHRQVVGSSTVAEGRDAPVHAVLWSDGEVLDLGTLGGRNSNANAITFGRWPDAGYATTFIVGSSQARADGPLHAFVWNRGRMRDLGTLPGDVSSQALDISPSGIIVGFSSDGVGGNRACMWTGDVIVDLNSVLPAGSEWRLLTATAINSRRQIVGEGRFRGRRRAYLLTLN